MSDQVALPTSGRLTGARPPLARAADVARLGILLAGASFLISGDWPAALKALLLLPPTLLGRVLAVRPGADFALALALAIEAAGPAFGAYETIGWWDSLSHTVLPFLSAPILHRALVSVAAAPELRPALPLARLGALVVTAAAVLAVGVAWELAERGADLAFGTTYSPGYSDTLSDLAKDAVGGLAGGLLVALTPPSGPPGPVLVPGRNP